MGRENNEFESAFERHREDTDTQVLPFESTRSEEQNGTTLVSV